MRTIVDLPENQVQALDRYRAEQRISRAEAVRRAVASFLPTHSWARIDFLTHPAFGSSEEFQNDDSTATVRRLRGEWE